MSNADRENTKFIHSFLFDSFYFLFAPVICLLFVLSVYSSPMMTGQVQFFSYTLSAPLAYFLSALNMGHVASVFYRSHLNKKVFLEHKKKILIAPPLVIMALTLSFDLLMLFLFLMVFWQTYHYSLQHFGIIRIYDGKSGSFSSIQRRLDILACVSFLFFPILAGTSRFMLAFDRIRFLDGTAFSVFLPHLISFMEFLDSNRRGWILCHFIIAAIYFSFTIYQGWKGKGSSVPKILFMLQLFGITTLGFLFFQPIIGILSLELLHSVQYYGLLSLSERGTTAKFLRRAGARALQISTLGIVVFIGVAFGVFSKMHNEFTFGAADSHWLMLPLAIIVGVNCLHFWMDSFVWGRKTEL